MKCKGFNSLCGKYKAIKFRARTFYSNEGDNWRILCPKCQEECKEYWNDMWKDYYNSVL